MKIDWASEGAITWDEFCTYMQLEYAEKEDSYKRAKDVDFHLPAKLENIPHRDPVLRITDTVDGTFVACSQVGTGSDMFVSIPSKLCYPILCQILGPYNIH